MIQLSLLEIADLLNTTTTHPDITIDGISIDSRTTKPRNLFVAIQGNRLDGHAFIDEAANLGAAALLVNSAVASALPQIIVKDTTKALGKLGEAWRSQFDIPVIAVTGSNGKTTLKNMLHSILVAARHQNTDQVLASLGTLNNHWGVPLTLTRLSHSHRVAVIEMGMNHFGEIAYLTTLARPTVAVITNAGASHLAGVGDIAGVAKAKGEIFSGLSADGTAILNRDDTFYGYWQKIVNNRPIVTFGKHQDADVRATLHDTAGCQQLTLHTPKGEILVTLPLLGQHNVMNALAATAASLAIHIPLTAIKQGLERIEAAPGRLQVHQVKPAVCVIDDTYNANPFSLQAAIDILSGFKGKRILVLGDMKELGIEAISMHEKAGKAIRTAGIDLLFTYGEISQHAAHSFGSDACHFEEHATLIAALKPLLCDQTTILVKGSRSMRMENVVANLLI